jgi:phenylacetate-CoA ligase
MAGLGERIYMASPIWAQQAAVATYGWWWYRRRFSDYFRQLVREFRLREDWTAEQFREYQELRLAKIMEAAWKAPYYRRVFIEAGLTDAKTSLEELTHLPFLSKETLRLHPRELLTEKSLPSGTLVQKTSGTTGTPTEIYYTPQFHALELAVPEARNLNWAGVTYRDRRVMFGVRKVCRFDQKRPPFWRYSTVEDLAYASIYHLSPEFLPSYIEFLRSFKPAVIMGYPSALYTIAKHALESGDLPAGAKGVFTTSETVTAEAREVIERVWQCRVYDRYGAVEGCVFGSQCEFGRYHISPEVGIIEILDVNGNACQPGVIGEVVCTGLQNSLQPLIRYRIGDAACWSINQSCECGRGFQILEAIEGRFEDICYTPDGRQMLRFDTVFKGVTNLREAQVVQERTDLFIIKVVPAEKFDQQDVARIESNMRLHAGVVQTKVELVSTIPRTSSGKFRAVICNLTSEQKRVALANGSNKTN